MHTSLPDDEQTRFVEYMKTSSACGIYFCIAALEKAELPYSLRESVYCIPLCQNTLSDYSMLLNDHHFSSNDNLPEHKPGRGMLRMGNEVYEMQCALPFGIAGDNRRREVLRSFGTTLGGGDSLPALRLTEVPMVLDGQALCNICNYDAGATLQRVPYALRLPQLEPLYIEDFDHPAMFVLGKGGTGKTAFLKARVEIHAMRPKSLCFILSGGDEWSNSDGRCLNVLHATDAEWDEWLSALADELQWRNVWRKRLPDWENPVEERGIALQFAPMILVLDDLEKWYGSLRLPADFDAYLKAIVRNGYKYNISLLSACTIGNTSVLPNAKIAELQHAAIGLATGNTLLYSNPWGVDLPYSRELERMRAGEGFLIEQMQPVHIMLPGKVR